MSAASLVETAALEGVELRMVNGELKVLGERAAVERWLPAIRERKAEVLEALRAKQGIPADERERLTSWLAWLGEDDPAIIAAFWRQVERDPEARHYYLEQAEQADGSLRRQGTLQ